MTILQLTILAIVQGLTEFLPISSSAHLILAPLALGAPDQGPAIDAAVHVGTLGAVMLYFRADVALAARGGVDLLRGRRDGPGPRLAALLILATIPVVVLGGALAATGSMERLRSIEVIGWTTLIWGGVLYLADRWGPTVRLAEGWTWRHALVMGLAQAAALVPGTSRSGITITAARALGYARVDSARLSMLMSIPAIGAAGALTVVELAAGEARPGLDAAIAAALSFLAALIALALLMRMLRGWTMTPFVIYRLILGVALLWIAYA